MSDMFCALLLYMYTVYCMSWYVPKAFDIQTIYLIWMLVWICECTENFYNADKYDVVNWNKHTVANVCSLYVYMFFVFFLKR